MPSGRSELLTGRGACQLTTRSAGVRKLGHAHAPCNWLQGSSDVGIRVSGSGSRVLVSCRVLRSVRKLVCNRVRV